MKGTLINSASPLTTTWVMLNLLIGSVNVSINRPTRLSFFTSAVFFVVAWVGTQKFSPSYSNQTGVTCGHPLSLVANLATCGSDRYLRISSRLISRFTKLTPSSSCLPTVIKWKCMRIYWQRADLAICSTSDDGASSYSAPNRALDHLGAGGIN